MDFACRGYPESIPNSLHKDNPLYNLEIHLLTLFPQYPPYLLLLLLLLLSFSYT
jgi:hypothetical protein